MRKIDHLLFGSGGIPHSTTPDHTTINGIKQIRKLGLGAMEMEFVQSVNVSEELAKEIKPVAEQENVVLTCHAPYYINLNADESVKVKASVKRLMDSAIRLNQAGGWSVIFHSGFYLGQSPEKVYEKIKKILKTVSADLRDRGIDVWLRPETMGRKVQFGSVKDDCRLAQDVENVLPGIDWSHLHALEGKHNTTKEFRETLAYVEKELGRTALNNMHCHISGINYSDKGEKNHMNLQKSDMNYKDLVKVWKEFNLKGVIISESPNLEEDAQLLQKLYGRK